MKRLIIVLSILFPVMIFSQIKTEEVTYNDGNVTMTGYMAYPDNNMKNPGVLVVHEWWGQNEYARKRAEMLAELGYTAFALDMYGEGKVAEHPDDAGKFSSAVMQNFDVAKSRFLAALKILQNNAHTDSSEIAAIGYCFGGGVVLNMARTGLDIDAVVSFHGSIAPAVQAKEIEADILVCHGEDDKMVTAEQIEAFKKEMEAADADYKFITYPGAKHSFTNPDADKIAQEFSIPVGYNKAADEKSWEDMKKFLHDELKD